MTRELEIVEESLFRDKVKVTGTSLTINQDVTFDQWQQIGQILRNIGGSIHFWLGDWLKFGEKKWGEKYAQAIEETGFDYGTLRNDVFVCENVDLSCRRDKLSFSHHAEVASLEPEKQKIWLDKAEKEHLTRSEFRQVLKEEKKQKHEHQWVDVIYQQCKLCRKLQRKEEITTS